MNDIADYMIDKKEEIKELEVVDSKRLENIIRFYPDFLWILNKVLLTGKI